MTGAQIIRFPVERRRELVLDAVIAREARQADRLSARIAREAAQPGYDEQIEQLMRVYFGSAA